MHVFCVCGLVHCHFRDLLSCFALGCSLCTMVINLKCGLLLLMPEYLACQCVCIYDVG
jgi:hypothetical protein